MAAAETVLVMDFSDSKIHSLNFGKAATLVRHGRRARLRVKPCGV
jgi:hypothetical protein